MSGPKRCRPNPKRRHNIRKRLAKRDGARCFYCRQAFTDELRPTIDHVVPYVLRPTWRLDALVLACLACNRRKGSMPIDVFLAELGRS